MLKDIKLVSNFNGTYDVVIEYEIENSEFGNEFNTIKNLKSSAQKIVEFVKLNSKKVKIASVRVIMSGILVSTLAFSSFMSVFGASDRYSMAYLYSGTDQQHIEYVNKTNGSLDTVSPSYFDIESDGSLKLNYLSKTLIETMHSQGIKVVPFLSNHWNRDAGINALKDVETLSTQVANYVEEYNLDGVNVDIENVTHEQREKYTELVKLLREKIPKEKEVSVAVAANPNDWQTGWHGSYDYEALGKYADHLLIMAYDEHYEGGSSGPVASIDFVENSIKYALSKTSAEKIVVGIPLYGRVWSLDNEKIVGKGISIKTINEILQNCKSSITYDENSKSVKAEFEITETSQKYTVGGDFVLSPGKYVVWYENDLSYSSKLNLVSKYNIKGAGSWALGQEDPEIWSKYDSWIGGNSTDNSTPSNPDDSSGSQEDTPPETTPPSEDNSQETILGVVNKDTNIYKNQNLKGKIVSKVSIGTTITIIKSFENGVCQVKLSDGKVGYISAEYINLSSVSSPSDESAQETPNETQNYILYEIQSGDTLWKLSEKYLGSGFLYNQIKIFNGLTSDVIYPGMIIKIPVSQGSDFTDSTIGYREYTVKRNDTLWKIAQKELGNGSRYTEIKTLNNLSSDTIYSGQVLKLPID